jgi:hypothetical protein
MDQSGECWPSHQHTANRVGLSEKQVRRHVTKLKSLGLITVIRNEKGGRPGDTPRYRALFKVSDDARGDRTPANGSPTTPAEVVLKAPIRPRGLPSMSEYPSHQWEPNRHRIVNKLSMNQGASSIKNDMPKELTSWAAIHLASELLGLTIRENNPIESQSEFQRRVQAAHKAYWLAVEIEPHGKSE